MAPASSPNPSQARRRIGLFVTLALFALAVGLAYRAIDLYRVTHATLDQLADAADTIRYSDEVLTNSARMAAFTGSRQWQRRYDDEVPQLDAAIDQAIRLFPRTAAALAQTREANERLIVMERQALQLAAQGALQQAQRILLSEAYDRDKATYGDGLARLRNGIDEHRAEIERQLERDLTQVMAVVLGLLALVVLALVQGLRLMGQRLAIETAVGEIGRRLMSPRTIDLDGAVDEVLGQIAQRAGADHAYLLRRVHGRGPSGEAGWTITHAYPAQFKQLDPASQPALVGTPTSDGGVWVPSLATLPPVPVQRKPLLEGLGVGTLLGVHVWHTREADYYFGLAGRRTMVWTASELPLVRTIADIVTSALDVAAKEAELQRLATIDPLTGLANRREFTAALAREAARVRRAGASAALLLIDLDHFKQINDRHGHAGGDAALVHFAQCTRKQLRDIDLVGRIGGEEFAALLPDTSGAAALAAAERLRAAVEAPSGNAEVPAITISIGVALLDSPTADGEQGFKRADAALYAAKRAGRNCVRLAQAD